MHRSAIFLILCSLAAWGLAVDARAEVSQRFCFTTGYDAAAGGYFTWHVAPGATELVSSMEFNIDSKSDMILAAQIGFRDSTVFVAGVPFRVRLSVQKGSSETFGRWYDYVTPQVTANTVYYQDRLSNMAAGDYTMKVYVENLSLTDDVVYSSVVHHSLFVDESEWGQSKTTTTPITLTSNFHLVHSIAQAPSSLGSKTYSLGSHLTFAGTGVVDIQFKSGGLVLQRWHNVRVSPERPFYFANTVIDNITANTYIKGKIVNVFVSEVSGNVTSTSGNSFIQSLRPYTVIRGTTTSTTAAAIDNVEHSIFTTPWFTLNAESTAGVTRGGKQMTAWWGTGDWSLFIPSGSAEVNTLNRPERRIGGSTIVNWFSNDGGRDVDSPPDLASFQSDGGIFGGARIGADPNDEFRMNIKSRTNCNRPGESVFYDEKRVAIAIMPDFYDNEHICAGTFITPDCAFACEIGFNLQSTWNTGVGKLCNPGV